MKNILVKIFVFSFFLSFFSLRGQTAEYKLKAVFMERFTRFVEWPDHHAKLSDSTESFVIKIIGKNPFDIALDNLYSNTKIKDKKVKIYYINKSSDIDSCHILFISRSMEIYLDKILAYTRNKPILTVSDHTGFAEQGVIINFFIANNKLRFEINESALIKSKLYMSYLLLNVAHIIKDKEGKQ